MDTLSPLVSMLLLDRSCVIIFLKYYVPQHSLPTTDVLKRRNMSLADAGPLCGAEDPWRHDSSGALWLGVCALSDGSLVEKMTENREPSAKNWIIELLY